jgi:hypothetical protein
MCTCTQHNEKKYRLADFFDANWESYIQDPPHPITPEQYRAVNAIRVCRTAALGVDYYICLRCGDIKEIYHNCKHRFCPTCSWSDTIKWAEKIKGRLLNIPHRHVVFTVPHALIPLIKINGKELLNILLRTSADTFKDWISYKYQIKPGILSVLHTWGETKEYHLHVHMIVSWGGLDQKTGELKAIEGDYVNYDFLHNKFRNKFEDSLVSLYNEGKLEHKFSDKRVFLRYLREINKKNWIIHLEPPMSAASAVIRYIGRYSKRACLSENKITEIEGEYISFRHKDYKMIGEDKRPIEKILRLHYREFFSRLLQHVPLPHFQMVRYYGIYATKTKTPKAYLNKEIETEEQWNWENPFVCSFCGQERVYMFTIFDVRQPKLRLEKFDIKLHPSYIFKRA